MTYNESREMWMGVLNFVVLRRAPLKFENLPLVDSVVRRLAVSHHTCLKNNESFSVWTK